jgi:hypothetical protein
MRLVKFFLMANASVEKLDSGSVFPLLFQEKTAGISSRGFLRSAECPCWPF